MHREGQSMWEGRSRLDHLGLIREGVVEACAPMAEVAGDDEKGLWVVRILRKDLTIPRFPATHRNIKSCSVRAPSMPSHVGSKAKSEVATNSSQIAESF